MAIDLLSVGNVNKLGRSLHTMSGETNLKKLLQNMAPVCMPGIYVFCTLSSHRQLPPERTVGYFREAEGPTVIVEKQVADEYQLAYNSLMAWISLSVHSSLEAVGLTAAVATALAAEGISCNVVAAYFHDHLFVPEEDAERALAILQELSRG